MCFKYHPALKKRQQQQHQQQKTNTKPNKSFNSTKFKINLQKETLELCSAIHRGTSVKP